MLLGAVVIGLDAVVARRVEGDVGGQRGLPHGGSAGEDEEIRGVQAAELVVEVDEAGGHAGHAAVAVVGAFHHGDGAGQGLAERPEAALVLAFLGEAEKVLLGLLDLLARRGVHLVVVGLVDDVLAEGDELAPEVEVVDRAGVILGVDDGHRRADKAREILGAADVAERLVVLEIVLESDRVGELAALDELEDGLVDAAVDGLEEMFGPQEPRDDMGLLVVDQQGAQERLLGLVVVGKSAIGDALVPLVKHALHPRDPLRKLPRRKVSRGPASRPLPSARTVVPWACGIREYWGYVSLST